MGLTGQTAAKISRTEAYDLLEGKLPNGTEIPIYPFDELKRGINDLPMRYGVVLDFELARKAKRGYEYIDILQDEANMIVRAGGVEPLAAYLDKYRERHKAEVDGGIGTPTTGSIRINPKPAYRFWPGNKGGTDSDDFLTNPRLEKEDIHGYDTEYGLGGDASMVGMARYVAVAPRNVSTSLQYLDFEP